MNPIVFFQGFPGTLVIYEMFDSYAHTHFTKSIELVKNLKNIGRFVILPARRYIDAFGEFHGESLKIGLGHYGAEGNSHRCVPGHPDLISWDLQEVISKAILHPQENLTYFEEFYKEN